MGDLRECPFCGNPTARKLAPFTGEPYFPGFIVQCDASGWDGMKGRGCGSSTGWQETEEEAVAAWNRRAHPTLYAAEPTK